MMSHRKDRFSAVFTLTFILLAVFIGKREYVLKPASAAASSSLVRDFTDIPLPGAPVRFDYQSMDAKSGLLYISHMGDNHVVIFNVHTDKVVANIPDCPGSTGVLYLPQYNRIISSASAAHEVVIIDASTRKIIATVGGIRFPDGIAYAPKEHRLFVSDEAGGNDVVIDARTNRKLASIALGGQAGNTRYDRVSDRILVNVQTLNQMVAIDPATLKIIGRYNLTGGEGPHGMYLDEKRRIAFIACEDDATLLVVDLRTMRVTATYPVGGGPDVLAFDPVWRRLYVAAESGVVTVFDEIGSRLKLVGEIKAPHAHSVAVDPDTHRVYLPLQNIDGRPVLRILSINPPSS